jgi:transposase
MIKQLKPQTPATGIIKNGDYGDSMFYTVVCDCGQQDCAHELMIEADDMAVTVTTYVRSTTRWLEKNRWKQLWQILTKGYVDAEAVIYMEEQTALNYAATLKSAVQDVGKFRNARLSKTNNNN